MKKTLLFTVLIAVMVLSSCRTSGPVMSPRNPTEETLLSIYERFRGDLILIGARRHTVQSGETLAEIARARYDDGFMYPLILLASNDVVLDPDRIAPGMVLTIPDLQRNLNAPRARENLRNFMLEIATFEESRNRGPTAAGLRARANAL